MVDELPEPLVPPHVDCRKLSSFMLNVERLMASELVALASHEAIAGALFLWCRAWQQRPAASLPNDERVLASYARLPIPRFRKLRTDITRGFVLCRDGRLYHPVLSEEAMRAYEASAKYRNKRDADAERLRLWRANNRRQPDQGDATGIETAEETLSETQGETRFVHVRDETVRDETTSSSAADAAVVDSGPSGPRVAAPPCPHEQIIALWAEVLPECPQVREWTPARQAHLRARWRDKALNGGKYAHDQAEGLAYWRRLFAHVRESKFLMGHTPGRDGRLPFQVTLPWLLKPENFAKVVEGAYHDGD
jgi:hypothetical protein